MDDLSLGPSLASTRVLIAGGAAGTAERLRGQLAGAGLPAADVAPDVDAPAPQATQRPPHAIPALGGMERALRERLDPLGLSEGPPIISVSGLTGDGAVVAYLRLALERHGLRRRLSELESVLAGQALARSRESEQSQLDAL